MANEDNKMLQVPISIGLHKDLKFRALEQGVSLRELVQGILTREIGGTVSNTPKRVSRPQVEKPVTPKQVASRIPGVSLADLREDASKG